MWRFNENIKEIRAKAERDFTNRVFSTIAPFYNTKITAGNLKEIRTKVEDDFTRRANHVANLLGINLIGITTNIENFGLEKGKTAAEAMANLSYTFELEGSPEKTAVFASLVNDLGYEPQETVITSKVVNSAEEADAVQITYPLGSKSRKETLELINKLGIENYSIDPRTNVITVTVFNQKNGKLTLTAEEAEKQKTLSEELYGKYDPKNEKYIIPKRKVHFNISVKGSKNAESAKRKVQFGSPNACRNLPRFYRRFIAHLIGASRWVCIRVAT